MGQDMSIAKLETKLPDVPVFSGKMLKRLFERFRPARFPSPAVGTGPIGLDFGLEGLSAVQLEATATVPRVRDAVFAPYVGSREALWSTPRDFRSFVRKVFQGRRFVGRRVVSCLPGGGARLIYVSYPSATGQADSQAAVKSALDRLDGNPSDFVFDCLHIRSRDQNCRERNALVAAAKREGVESYLDLLTGAGLEASAIDVGPAALRRLVNAFDKDRKYPSVLLINFGRERSYLTVLIGERLVMDREVRVGEEVLIEVLSRTLETNRADTLRLLRESGFDLSPGPGGKDDVSASVGRTLSEILKPLFLDLAEEVSKVLIYTASQARGRSVEQVYLLGSVAGYPGTDHFLKELLSLPVRVMNPFACLLETDRVAKEYRQDSRVGMALATGLALRGLAGDG